MRKNEMATLPATLSLPASGAWVLQRIKSRFLSGFPLTGASQPCHDKPALRYTTIRGAKARGANGTAVTGYADSHPQRHSLTQQ